MISRIKATVVPCAFSEAVSIYLFKYEGRMTMAIEPGYDGKLALRVVEEGVNYSDVKPLLVFPSKDAHSMLKAIGDAINIHGVRLDADAKNEGQLEATKYHLEDMRNIVERFLTPRVVHRTGKQGG